MSESEIESAVEMSHMNGQRARVIRRPRTRGISLQHHLDGVHGHHRARLEHGVVDQHLARLLRHLSRTFTL